MNKKKNKKMNDDDDLRVFDVKNILPTYNDVSKEEHDFYNYYVRFFKLETNERIDIPYLMLFPTTMENLIVDFVRGYNHFLYMKKNNIDTEMDLN